MKRPRAYKVGDYVRVLRPRWVKRVGYPLHWRDLLEEVEKDPRSWEALAILEGRLTEGPFAAKRLELPRDFAMLVAKMRVAERDFGGRKRAIIYEEEKAEDPDVLHFGPSFRLEYLQHCCVRGRRVAYTGTYCRGGTNWTSDGPEDYPAELADAKAHVLLLLDCGWEIEACNVELVKEASDNA
jgi:hypothetical protein